MEGKSVAAKFSDTALSGILRLLLVIVLVVACLSALPVPAVAGVGGPYPDLTMNGYRWQNDDGTSPSTNSNQAAANTSLTSVKSGERLTLRTQVTNTGSALSNTDVGLFYDHGDNIWTKVGSAASKSAVAGSACSGDSQFTCSNVAATDMTGIPSSTSIVVDTAGTPWFAYYYGDAVMVAKYVGTGGSGCASSTAWTCIAVETGAGLKLGKYVKLGFDSKGRAWLAYYDWNTFNLHVARYVGSGGNCTSTEWSCSIVDASVGGSYLPGAWLSIAFDNNENPWISYFDSGNNVSRIAHYVGGASGSGCTDNDWSCETIQDHDNGDNGYWSSMAFLPDGTPVVTYYQGASSYIRYAQRVGTGGTGCGSTITAWTCSTVLAQSFTPRWISMTLDNKGEPWIEFQDQDGLDQWVAHYVGSGGTGCGGAISDWNCTLLASAGDTGYAGGIGVDAAGSPWIISGGNANSLNLYRYVGTGGSGCVGGNTQWKCTSIITGADASIASIAFAPDGAPWISYANSSGYVGVATLNRSNEIVTSPSPSGTANGASITSAVTDSGCTNGSANWTNGKWSTTPDIRGVSLPNGTVTPQCTELAWVLDTSNALTSRTYRFMVATQDGWRFDKQRWRGPSTISNYPTFSTAGTAYDRFSKDVLHDGSNCTSSEWTCEQVATSFAGFGATSMAIAPDGNPWVLYRDDGDGEIRIAKYVGSGGSGCASSAWDCSTVEVARSAAYGVSLAFSPDGTAWAAYAQDMSGGVWRLRLATSTGGSWTKTTVDSTVSDVGGSPAMRIGADGNPWIAYSDATNHAMKVAHYVGGSGGNCTDSAWLCNDIYDTTTLEFYNSMQIDDYGRPWVAFYDRNTNDAIVAHYVGQGGFATGVGCLSASWTCEKVMANNNLGAHMALVVDSSNTPRIAFQDETTHSEIWTAVYVGSGGNCDNFAGSDAWQCSAIVSQAGAGEFLSMALDSENHAWLTYEQGGDRYIARQVSSGGAGCYNGANGDAIHWNCLSVMDTDDTQDGAASIAFDRTGTPWISYATTTSDLKVAKLHASPVSGGATSNLIYPSNNAFTSDGRYHLDSGRSPRSNVGSCDANSNQRGYCAITPIPGGDYDSITATAAERPMFQFASGSPNSGLAPTMTWSGRSTVSPTTNPITAQIFRFGSTNAWETLTPSSDTCASASANADCTISAQAGGTPAEYIDQVSGLNWVYVRVVQQSSGSSQTLRSNGYTMSFSSGVKPNISLDGSVIENDDQAPTSTVDSNTLQAAPNTPVTAVNKGERMTVRAQISNNGGPIDGNLGLFYDNGDGNWTKVRANAPPQTSVPGTTCAVSTWRCDDVFDGPELQPYTAIGPDGHPWVAYRDSGSGKIGLAHYTGGSGGAGCLLASWSCEFIGTSTNSFWPALAFGPDGKPWIAYYNADTLTLNVARYVGAGAGSGCLAGSENWSCTAINAAVTNAAEVNNGHDTRIGIAIDSGGTAWIAYDDTTNVSSAIARYVGGGGGTGCSASSDWTCERLDTGTDTGRWSTQVAISSTGAPWVSYFDTNDLRVAQYVGSGNGNGCDNTTAWTCTTIDDKGPNSVGGYSDIAFGPDGSAWISYQYGNNMDAMTAHYVGSGGSNCANSAWTCYTVLNHLDTGNPEGYEGSIAIDAAGKPWYTFLETGSADLIVARFVGSGGNCSDTAWQCTKFDSADVVGDWPSIAFDHWGKPWIASNDASGTPHLRVDTIATGGEITLANGLGGLGGATLDASHADMSSVGDSANRADADCLQPGTLWNNGYWFTTEDGSLGSALDGGATPDCTEVAWVVDTSQATPGATYRFMIAIDDGSAPDRGRWRGPSSITSGAIPQITIAANTTLRLSKDNLPDFADCSNTAWGCVQPVNTGNGGGSPSIQFDSQGVPWAAYVYTAAGSGDFELWIAKYVGTGGNCIGSAGWQCTKLVDGNPGITSKVSLAFGPGGDAWLSYYTSDTLDLNVAHYVGTSGTGCASSAWTCTAIDTAGDVGGYDKLAVDARGNVWISYYDATNSRLKVARYAGTGGTGCAVQSWTCTGLTTSGGNDGEFTDIAVDSTGAPWISYDYQNGSNGADLMVAHYVGVGGSGCATGITDWNCESVFTAGPLGAYTAIAIGQDDQPWIAAAADSELWVVHRIGGAGGTGCLSGGNLAWNCEAVDVSTFRNTVQGLDIAMDPQGRPWVTYPNTSNQRAYVWRPGDGNGTGCYGGAPAYAGMWTGCNTVIDNFTDDWGWASMAFDATGTPWIAYTAQFAADSDLRIAKLHTPSFKPIATSTQGLAADNGSRSGPRYVADFGKSPRTEAGSACSSVTNNQGYCGATTQDAKFDSVTGVAGETVVYQAAGRFAANTINPLTWTGQSTVAPTSQGLKLQAFRFGTTNAWEDVTLATDTCSSAGANATCTMSGTPSGTASEYFEADGSNYWQYFRAVQARGGSGPTLRTDLMSFAAPPANSAPNAPVNLAQTKTNGDPIPKTTVYSYDSTTGSTFEAVAGATLSVDPTIKRTGAGSMKATGVQDGFWLSDGASTPRDMSANGRTFSAWVYVPSANTGTTWGADLVIYHADGSTFTKGSSVSVPRDTWTFISVTPPPDLLANMTHITVDLYGGSGGTNTAYVDDVQQGNGIWTNETSVRFAADVSDQDAADTDQLCIEVQPVSTPFSDTEQSCGTGVAYSGTAVGALNTVSSLTNTTQYHWQARVKDAGGLYSSWVQYGGNADPADVDFAIDTAAPTTAAVYDGSTAGMDVNYNDGSLSQISSNWDAFTDATAGLTTYQYSIGTSAGATDIRNWTDNATTAVTATGLTLQTGVRYYFNVRALDGAGNTSAVVSSDGQSVAPTLSFSVSSSTIALGSLTPGNSYTGTGSATLTMSTNAYNGYEVRGFQSTPFSAGSASISGFDGGSYANPDTWQASDTGIGYTSSDTLIGGVNKFQSATCPGGTLKVAPGCYAPFATSGPGDVVADNSGPVTGTSIVSDSRTISLRATALPTQAAGVYSTRFVLSATALF